jgi:hypothetical protein
MARDFVELIHVSVANNYDSGGWSILLLREVKAVT